MRLQRLAIPVVACAAGLVPLAQMAAASPSSQDSVAVRSGVYRGVGTAARFDVSPPLRSIPPLPIKPETHTKKEDRPSGLEGPLGPQSVDPIVQSWVGPGEIPGAGRELRRAEQHRQRVAARPGGRRRAESLRRHVQPVLRDLQQDRDALYGPAANNTLWSGFGGPCQTENSGDPDRALRPARRPLDAHPVHLRRARPTTTAWPSPPPATRPGPTTAMPSAPARTSRTTRSTASGPMPTTSARVSLPGASFAGVGAYALNRAQMIAGNPAPQVISFLATPAAQAAPSTSATACCRPTSTAPTPPPAGSPEYLPRLDGQRRAVRRAPGRSHALEVPRRLCRPPPTRPSRWRTRYRWRPSIPCCPSARAAAASPSRARPTDSTTWAIASAPCTAPPTATSARTSRS